MIERERVLGSTVDAEGRTIDTSFDEKSSNDIAIIHRLMKTALLQEATKDINLVSNELKKLEVEQGLTIADFTRIQGLVTVKLRNNFGPLKDQLQNIWSSVSIHCRILLMHKNPEEPTTSPEIHLEDTIPMNNPSLR